MARTQIDKSLIASINSSSNVGTSTNNDAATGIVGEYIEGLGSGVSVVNADYGNIATITLTAGDWDINFTISFSNNSSSGITAINAFVSLISGSGSTGQVFQNTWSSGSAVPNASVSLTGTLPRYRVSIASTTPYFLKARRDGGTGTLLASGIISARRMR